MNIHISINTDNAVFQEEMNTETINILSLIINKLERDEWDIYAGEEQAIFDTNGNIVGSFHVTQ
jgi:hypothetical protein